MHRLVCLGLSHRTAPVELRERIGALGPGAERCPAVLEHAVLQTCYRVELYARLTSGVEDARDELVDALSTAHGVSRELLLDHLYVHSGEDVARHLCRVAAGLDSLVLGEAEILGQVGDAFQSATVAGTVGPVLTLLFRTAISSGRRARSETAIGANPATASSMAVALAEGVLGDLREKHVLVVGAGRIGLQTLQAAEGRGIARIAVANRTQDRALQVSEPFGATGHDLGELATVLAAADVAISATSSEAPVVRAEVVRAAMRERADRPLVLVDLAVPGDVEREAGDVDGVRLFDVDDLRAGLDGAMAARLREVPKVEAVVEDEVEELRPALPRARSRAAPLRAAQAGGVDPRA